MKKSFLSTVLAVFAFALMPLLAGASNFWNYSDTTKYHDADTLWTTTNLYGVTYVTNGSSAERVPIFQTCSERTGTSCVEGETLTFTMRMKFNGSTSSAYRWYYFTASPGDTIEIWGNSTSSSSARTLTLKAGGYNGGTIGTISLATGSEPSYGYAVYEGTKDTTIAVLSSGSWYTYAIRLKSNPNYSGGGDTPTEQHWFFKHGWGDGLDASWDWRELTPNEDKSLYTREDVYGGTGCNYADNKYGTGSVWVPLDQITLENSPAMGDSALFIFNPSTCAITIRKTKDAPADTTTVAPDPTKTFSMVGGKVYLDNSEANWADANLYLAVGNDAVTRLVRFLPDADGKLVCPMPYVKDSVTYMAVIGNSHFTSGSYGYSNLTVANHYTAAYTTGLQSGVNDGWTIKIGAENGSAMTITKLDGEYGEKFTTQEMNNCYRLDDALRQITFIFSTSRTRFVISPLNAKKIYVYGSITNWSQTDEDYVLSGFNPDGCFYVTLKYDDIVRTGNGGQPEFLFNVYHVNGNSYVTQSWPTLEEGCPDYLTFCSNGWKQIVAWNDDDVQNLADRKATALYIRPLSDFDLTTRTDQEKISNFRQVPGTKNLYRSYHPWHSSRSEYDTEPARFEWIAKLATEAGIKSDIALSGDLTAEDGKSTYTTNGVTYTESIPDYYRPIIESNSVCYVGTVNGHTPSYDQALYYTDQERFAQWIQEIVQFINDDAHEVPFQIHCHLGADRTGVFSGIFSALCGASWDDIAADYIRTSDLQISEYRHSNQLRYATSLVAGYDPMILPSGENAVAGTFTTLEAAKEGHTSYTGGCTMYTYPEAGTALPTLQQAIAAHFVQGGYLTQAEIDKCVAKLRGETVPTGITNVNANATTSKVSKILKDGQIIIVRDGVNYDILGRQLTK